MERRTVLALAAGTIASAGCLRDATVRSPAGTAAPRSPVPTAQRSEGSGANVAWARRYGTDGGKETSTPGNAGIFPVSVARGAEGGFALGGSRNTRDGSDSVLLQTDSKGRSRWFKRYGGDRRDETHSLIRTEDGGFLLLGTDGRREAPNKEPPDKTPYPTRTRAWAGKVSGDGSMIWDVHPVEDRHAELLDGVQLADRSYALAGWADHDTGRAALFVRLDPNGQIITRQTYNSEKSGPTQTMPASGEPKYQDLFTSVCRGTDGGLVFGGENNRGGWIVHTDEKGMIRWNRDLTYPRDIVGDVSLAADGGYVATGRLYEREGNEHTVTDTRNPSDLYLLRLNRAGQRQWTRAYDGGRNEAGDRVIQTADGGFIVAGGSFAQRKQDLFLVKTNPAGILEWSDRFEFSSTGGGSAEEPWPVPSHGHDIVEIDDGEYAIAAENLFLKVVAT